MIYRMIEERLVGRPFSTRGAGVTRLCRTGCFRFLDARYGCNAKRPFRAFLLFLAGAETLDPTCGVYVP